MMRNSTNAHVSGNQTTNEAFLEFNFFDGVMVECNEINPSEFNKFESQETNLREKNSSACEMSAQEEFVNKKMGNHSDVRETSVLESSVGCHELPLHLPMFERSILQVHGGDTCMRCLKPSQGLPSQASCRKNFQSDSSASGEMVILRNPTADSDDIWDINIHHGIPSVSEMEICISANEPRPCNSTEESSAARHTQNLQLKNIPFRKQEQHASVDLTQVGEKMFKPVPQGHSPNNISVKHWRSVFSNHLSFSSNHFARQKANQNETLFHGPSHLSSVGSLSNSKAVRPPGNLAAGCIDWIWSEVHDGDGTARLLPTGSRHFATEGNAQKDKCPALKSISVHATNKDSDVVSYIGKSSSLTGLIMEMPTSIEINPPSAKKISTDSTQGAGTSILAARATVGGVDSPKCYAAGEDLIEIMSPKEGTRSILYGSSRPVASFSQLTGSYECVERSHGTQKLAHVDLENSWEPVFKSYLHLHSSNSPSSSKREPLATPTANNLSLTDYVPAGTMHGLLHSSLRDGLPNYTFLLDDSEEVITAKIWIDDTFLGEEAGAWRYTFYSLKGKGKRKGSVGWKHWKRKEKLSSEIVGKMNVSSVLNSEFDDNGQGTLFVVSEFVLYSARNLERTSTHQTTSIFKTNPSSPDLSPIHSLGSHQSRILISPKHDTCTSPLQAVQDTSSPGVISAWYVSQSLLPRSLVAPQAGERKKRHSKWSTQVGHTWIQTMQDRSKVDLSSNLLGSNQKLNGKEYIENLTGYPSQSHSELAAMVIKVPLEKQEGRQGESEHSPSIGVSEQLPYGVVPLNKSLCRSQESTTEDAGNLQRICNQIKGPGHQKQASITVILPAGNHGRPLSDSKGPPPLIERWKDGGKCDCKGWDLGCGLTLLSNHKQSATNIPEGDQVNGTGIKNVESHFKRLTLYKQDKEREDASISLAPLCNGLISVEFRAHLSPIQAFAVAVSILHGREPVVPCVGRPMLRGLSGMPYSVSSLRHDKSQVSESATQCLKQGGNFLSGHDPALPLKQDSLLRRERTKLGVSAEKTKSAPHLHGLTSPNCRDKPQLQGDLGTSQLKQHGGDLLSCLPDPPLSFERV